MKKTVWTLVAACLLGAMGQAYAADTASISVTVSLESVISVSLDHGSWTIPPIALGGNATDTWVATVGNTACKLEIVGTDGAGGWTLGATAGADQFAVTAVAAPSPSVALSKTYQTLAANVAAYGTKSFTLTYNAPTSDTKGGGVAQGFTVTVKASAP